MLNELTRILPPQVWTSRIEIYPDSVVIRAKRIRPRLSEAARFLALFQNSEFALSVTRNCTQGEAVSHRSMRRNRAGRTTP